MLLWKESRTGSQTSRLESVSASSKLLRPLGDLTTVLPDLSHCEPEPITTLPSSQCCWVDKVKMGDW